MYIISRWNRDRFAKCILRNWNYHFQRLLTAAESEAICTLLSIIVKLLLSLDSIVCQSHAFVLVEFQDISLSFVVPLPSSSLVAGDYVVKISKQKKLVEIQKLVAFSIISKAVRKLTWLTMGIDIVVMWKTIVEKFEFYFYIMIMITQLDKRNKIR